MDCPRLLKTVVISDDEKLAAQLSCHFAKPGHYLTVLDGPRMTRPDARAEVIRRNNACARVKPSSILLAGLSQEADAALTQQLGIRRISRVQTSADISQMFPATRNSTRRSPLLWGRDRVGVGLLTALWAKTTIEFSDKPSPITDVPAKSGHLVVCDEEDALAQVIAANYAFSLDAGLWLSPHIPSEKVDEVLEEFYGSQEQLVSQTEVLEQLRAKLRNLCGRIPVPDHGSLTFVTSGLPFGFGYSECPSTHLFNYPDLGIAVVNGFAAEQPATRGIGTCILVDPETTPAPEIDDVIKILKPRGVFIRGYQGRAANVRWVSDAIERFPYDLLLIATHCGDVSGSRWTYEIKDSEGKQRTFVIDVGVGFGQTDDPDVFGVTQFNRFVSLDGVDLHNPEEKAQLYIGTAINDFVELTRPPDDRLEPISKVPIERVIGSAALKMYDSNYISLPKAIAGENTPIIINNACVSWHRLAANFIFGNARAYIGSLINITPTEAHDIIVRLLDKHHGKPLPLGLWSAQREVYGDSVRRPYIMTGVYPQRIRTVRYDVPREILNRLSKGLATWIELLAKTDKNESRMVKNVEDIIAWYKKERDHFRRDHFPAETDND
jgi:hypothetical protein